MRNIHAHKGLGTSELAGPFCGPALNRNRTE